MCGDLFTQLGNDPALTDGDLVGPAIAAEDMFKYSCLNPAWAPRSAASPISRPTHWHLCTVHLLPAMAPALRGPWPTSTTVAFPVRSPKYFGAWQPKSFGRSPLLAQSGHHSSVMAAVELTSRC